MSGHSKWATIKHKKAANDKARGKLFAKVLRQVEVAAREGGGDPDMNPTLRTMFQKARDASIPIDTIERAVKRGTGELEGVTYEQITYEGYAPAAVAVMVEVLTDNRNRTGAEIRNIFSKNGGATPAPAAVGALSFVSGQNLPSHAGSMKGSAPVTSEPPPGVISERAPGGRAPAPVATGAHARPAGSRDDQRKGRRAR